MENEVEDLRNPLADPRGRSGRSHMFKPKTVTEGDSGKWDGMRSCSDIRKNVSGRFGTQKTSLSRLVHWKIIRSLYP